MRTAGLIALLVAMLAVLSAVQGNLLTRLPEFAILRAVGWSRTRIGCLVVGKTLVLASFGGLFAPGIGQYFFLLVRPSNRETAGFVTDHLNVALWPETLVLTLSAAFAAALIPLARVLRVAPAEVLRTP